MSGSKMSRNSASLAARSQGGGPILSGLAPRVGKEAIMSTAYNRTSNVTDTRLAYKLLGSVCRKGGVECDRAINAKRFKSGPFQFSTHPNQRRTRIF